MNRRSFMAGLGAAPLANPGGRPLRVVASFSILADIVRQVGGGRISVSELIGPGSDPHAFEPAAAAVSAVADASLVVVNGLGFEGWIDRLISASGHRAALVVASRGVSGLTAGGAPDPHAWHDPSNGAIYARNIAVALARVDPAGAAAYAANAKRYADRLADLDRGLRGAFAALPGDRRTVLTSHDAFAYFGRAYGVRFLGLEGMSTKDEVSARRVAEIIRIVGADRATVFFVESAADPWMLREVSRETGLRTGARSTPTPSQARQGRRRTTSAC